MYCHDLTVRMTTSVLGGYSTPTELTANQQVIGCVLNGAIEVLVYDTQTHTHTYTHTHAHKGTHVRAY